jgi:hypothetical protein
MACANPDIALRKSYYDRKITTHNHYAPETVKQKITGLPMSHEGLTPQHRKVGQTASFAVFVLTVAYMIPLTLGLLSLKSPLDPIGEPYFTIMELLIVLMAPCMLVSMVVVHYYASPKSRVYSLAALSFMVLVTGLTSCIHFSMMTVGHQFEATGLTWVPLLFSFKWPSVIYALDILAWDIFFPLSMLFAAPVFTGGKLEESVRILMILSAILCFAGLIGVPLADMNYRNIGIIGYTVVAAVAFLFVGIIFGRTRPTGKREQT